MPKTIDEPRNARSKRTWAALLTATREIIESEGFEALTMAAVAERAGVSRRAIYLHFSTRNELLTALYRSLGEVEELAASLQAVWDSPDSVAALREWAAHIARAHPRILAINQAVDRSRHGDPHAEALWRETQRRWLLGTGRLMAWLAEEERLTPGWTTDSATDMMFALMSFDVLDRLIGQRGWSQEQVAEHLGELFARTFADPQAR